MHRFPDEIKRPIIFRGVRVERLRHALGKKNFLPIRDGHFYFAIRFFAQTKFLQPSTSSFRANLHPNRPQGHRL